MTRPESPSHWIARVGLAVGVHCWPAPCSRSALPFPETRCAPRQPWRPRWAPPRRPPPIRRGLQKPRRFPTTLCPRGRRPSSAPGARPRHRRLRFRTGLSQLSYPPQPRQRGARPERVEMRMEGRIDQPARTLEFRSGSPAWRGQAARPGRGTPAAAPKRGSRATDLSASCGRRVEGGRGLQLQLRARQRSPGIPGGVKDVRIFRRGRHGCAQTCRALRFALDGPTLAAYLRGPA